MCKTRWTLALLVGLVAACGAPSTAIAPSRAPLADGAGLNLRSITTIAAQLLTPLEVRGLVARPIALVRSESGELRTRQVLVGADGVEALRVESALDGSLRLIAKSGVALESAALSESAATARALRQLLRLGLEMPGGGPAVRSAAGRTLVMWTRECAACPCPATVHVWCSTVLVSSLGSRSRSRPLRRRPHVLHEVMLRCVPLRRFCQVVRWLTRGPSWRGCFLLKGLVSR